ncbi:hypothetical protein FQN51_007888 [Onygenales sp. PD_10]|nr:hypothetical protein FQN51_007888 [Onygenales sp. PD_10]
MADLHLNPAHAGVHPATLALHADDPVNVVTDVAPPMHLSTTFRYSDNPDELIPCAELDPTTIPPTTHIYSRHTAPNTTRLETLLAPLLHARVITYSSGLSALHAVLIHLNPRRIAVSHGYHGSHGVIALLSRLSGLQKIPLDCPASDLQAGDVVLLETPMNPTGRAYSIEAYAEKAHSRGAYLVVDSTFGPPGLQEPFSLGADVVVHSGTKYLGGHSDLLCGVVATREEGRWRKLLEDRLVLGSVMGGLEGWLGVRSLRTLGVRVQRQSGNALELVGWVDGVLRGVGGGADDEVVKRVVESVTHASLQRDEKGEVPTWLKKQMPNGYGTVFSITLREERFARMLPSRLRFFHHATSLGGVESLIEWRALSDDTVDQRLMRISVGLEHWEDLKADLVRGMREVLEIVEGEKKGEKP